MNSTSPVFLVGCGRSGTTLLRLMLNAHPAFAIPLESHFVYQIARLRARGRWPGRLDTDGAFAQLRTFLQNHYYLSLWDLDLEPLFRRLAALSDRTHRAVFNAVFEEFRQQQGKDRWGDKTPRQVLYPLLISHFFPNAQFIQVLRDGRDVAMSLRGASWGPRYIALAGYYWKWSVLSGKVAGAMLGPERYLEVRYEDLVLSPENTLRGICRWLGIAYTETMLAYHRTDAAARYARQSVASRRVTTPPDTARVERWRRQMAPRARRSIVRQAGDLLALLEYDVPSLPPARRRSLRALDHLLDAATIAGLHAVEAYTGSERNVRARLLLDRARQLRTFFTGDLEAWARASVRWQRTVAGMLH